MATTSLREASPAKDTNKRDFDTTNGEHCLPPPPRTFLLVVCPAAISGVRAADVTAGSIAPDGPSVHALLIPSCARAGGQ